MNKITAHKQFKKQFSICCIVTNLVEYETMKNSFILSGFDSNTEFLVADNIGNNNFDAYEAINIFLDNAAGEYVLITHQDVRCIDDHLKLLNCLLTVNTLDPNWAVCGNAGGIGYKKMAYCISENGTLRKSKNLPSKVFTLDENLLIINNKYRLALSNDINSFHFYGTDLCLLANYLGYNTYVIDFLVNHLSSGNLKDMENHKPIFIEKYGNKLRSRFVQTSCTNFYIGNNKFKNKLYNSKFIFFFIKAFQRIKN